MSSKEGKIGHSARSAPLIHSVNTMIINRPNCHSDCKILLAFGNLVNFFISNMPKLDWTPVLKQFLNQDETKIALSWMKLSTSSQDLVAEVLAMIEEGPSIFAQVVPSQVRNLAETKKSHHTASTNPSEGALSSLGTSSGTGTNLITTMTTQPGQAGIFIEDINFTHKSPNVASLPMRQTPAVTISSSNKVWMTAQTFEKSGGSTRPRDVTNMLIPKTRTKLGNRT